MRNTPMPKLCTTAPIAKGRNAPPTWPRDATNETAEICSFAGSNRVSTTTPDGNIGPKTKPRPVMTTTNPTGDESTANSTSRPIAHRKYKTVARRTPIRSVPNPSTSRPIAIPIQKPDEAKLARYGVALRERNMNVTTQPEMAVSVPTYARK